MVEPHWRVASLLRLLAPSSMDSAFHPLLPAMASTTLGSTWVGTNLPNVVEEVHLDF